MLNDNFHVGFSYQQYLERCSERRHKCIKMTLKEANIINISRRDSTGQDIADSGPGEYMS